MTRDRVIGWLYGTVAPAALILIALTACADRLEQRQEAEIRNTMAQWLAICERSQTVADAEAISREAGDAMFRECIDWHLAQWTAQKRLESLYSAKHADPGLYIDDGVTVAPIRPAYPPQPVIVVTP